MKNPHVRMPRILLLVDEFQEFFTSDDKIAQEAGLLLDRLVRQGLAFWYAHHAGSQTLAGAYTWVSKGNYRANGGTYRSPMSGGRSASASTPMIIQQRASFHGRVRLSIMLAMDCWRETTRSSVPGLMKKSYITSLNASMFTPGVCRFRIPGSKLSSREMRMRTLRRIQLLTRRWSLPILRPLTKGRLPGLAILSLSKIRLPFS